MNKPEKGSPMTATDRLTREAQETAEVLLEDRGETNARAWISHCASRDASGFWTRVQQAFEKLFTECDCCGEMKPDCEDIVYQGMDTHACGKCRGNAEDEDEAADRGDWEYHQGRDE